MYHLSFTVWMLMKGQSDLLGPGRIFSVVLIYTTNVALLAGFLVLGQSLGARELLAIGLVVAASVGVTRGTNHPGPLAVGS